MPCAFERLSGSDVIRVMPRAFRDSRGFFMEWYKEDEFAAAGITRRFVQVNHSRSGQGVLRGLHFQQPPRPQAKLVRVVRGAIFDVAVDIRQHSPAYGRWIGEILSEENNVMLYIPEGYAHGFCVLSPEADVLYACTDMYAPECEAGIVWNDPALAIDWPVKNPLVSDKDASLPLLSRVIPFNTVIPKS
jgi:dTDP-4-dehydrorhamnose 3,5-epimerase